MICANPFSGICNPGTLMAAKIVAVTEMEQLVELEFVTSLMANALVKLPLEEQQMEESVKSAWMDILDCQPTRCSAAMGVVVIWEEATMLQDRTLYVTRKMGSVDVGTE